MDATRREVRTINQVIIKLPRARARRQPIATRSSSSSGEIKRRKNKHNALLPNCYNSKSISFPRGSARLGSRDSGSREQSPSLASRASTLNTSSSRDDDPRLVPVRELFVFLVIRGVPVPIQAITFSWFVSLCRSSRVSPRSIPSRDPSSQPSIKRCLFLAPITSPIARSIHPSQTTTRHRRRITSRRVTYAMVPNNGTAQNNPASTAFSLTRFAMPAAQSLNNPCITPVRIGESVYVTERRRVATLPMFPSSSVVSERESLPRRAKRSLKSKIEAPKVLKRFDGLLGGLSMRLESEPRIKRDQKLSMDDSS